MITHRILLTTGDPDGIGFEVATKALMELGPQRGFQFIIATHRSAPHSRNLRSLSRKFHLQSVSNLELADQTVDPKALIHWCSNQAAPFWVEIGAKACLEGRVSAIVTGPLSKQSIVRSGLEDMGHTGILQRVTGAKYPVMGFVGPDCALVLATGHIALGQVASEIDVPLLTNAFRSAQELRQYLPRSRAQLPIALLGLNPHAGEDGLIGSEEISVHRKVIGKFRRYGLRGPIPADSAFMPRVRRDHSVIIANYHDQGLGPFKSITGFSQGVHITLGLPIIRTSVDHGTAKDLFETGKAEHGSMLDALKFAIHMVKVRSRQR